AGDFHAARARRETAAEGGSGGKDLWVKLSEMCKASDDLDGALAAINRALEVSPLDFSALLARAVILDNLGDPNAGEEYGNALAQIRPDEEIPAPWQAPVAHAQQRRDEWRDKVQQHLLKALPGDLNPGERERAQRFISNRASTTRQYHQEPSDFHYPGMPEIEFHNVGMFQGLDRLEAATGEIRAEFEALVAAEAAEMVPYIQYPERVPLR